MWCYNDSKTSKHTVILKYDTYIIVNAKEQWICSYIQSMLIFHLCAVKHYLTWSIIQTYCILIQHTIKVYIIRYITHVYDNSALITVESYILQVVYKLNFRKCYMNIYIIFTIINNREENHNSTLAHNVINCRLNKHGNSELISIIVFF